MSITIDKNIVVQYFIALEPGIDWLAALSQLGEDKFQFNYRFRYHGSVHDPLSPKNKDKKSWSRLTIDADKEKALAGIQQIVTTLETVSGQKAHAVWMKDGNVDAFLEELQKAPYAHAVKLTEKDGKYFDAEGREFDIEKGLYKEPEPLF